TFKRADKIFPMTKQAFGQAYRDVEKRAGVHGLTFADLRHEAGSRFDQAGLTKGEHDLQIGHTEGDTRSIYVHARLKSVQDKLDKYTLGKPRHEITMGDR